MTKYLSFFVAAFMIVVNIHAQELNAKVTVNGSKVSGSQQLFSTLEEQLSSFINDRRWSDFNFQSGEKIDCSFIIIVHEAAASSFKSELLVQSRRPVFNAAYSTPMLNFRDPDFSFDYSEYQQLEFNINNLTDNLTATVAYYIYLILGLDFDSMSSLGGTPFFKQMIAVANGAQSQNWSGWSFSSTSRNRYSVADAFNNNIYDPFRRMWYQYHRLGLDEMSENIEKSRENVLTSLAVISEINSNRPASPLVTLFGDAKLDELVGIIAGADTKTKSESYELLSRIYPTRTNELEKIKR